MNEPMIKCHVCEGQGYRRPSSKGERLRFTRESLGLSIRQVAKLSGLSTNQVLGFERDEEPKRGDPNFFRNCLEIALARASEVGIVKGENA